MLFLLFSPFKKFFHVIKFMDFLDTLSYCLKVIYFKNKSTAVSFFSIMNSKRRDDVWPACPSLQVLTLLTQIPDFLEAQGLGWGETQTVRGSSAHTLPRPILEMRQDCFDSTRSQEPDEVWVAGLDSNLANGNGKVEQKPYLDLF